MLALNTGMTTAHGSFEHLAPRRCCTNLHKAQGLLAVAAFHDDEDNAVKYEHDGYRVGVVEVFVHPVIEEQANDSRRDTADRDHAPQAPRAALFSVRFLRREGVELVEIEQDDRHDSAQLDDHEEEREELIAHVELHEFIDQDHVARRRDGEPFGDAFDDADEESFECFEDHAVFLVRLLAYIGKAFAG